MLRIVFSTTRGCFQSAISAGCLQLIGEHIGNNWFQHPVSRVQVQDQQLEKQGKRDPAAAAVVDWRVIYLAACGDFVPLTFVPLYLPFSLITVCG